MAKEKENGSCGIGGQAVIEGLMMKNKEHYSIAVRKPDGEIEIMTGVYQTISPLRKLTEIPFIRGVFNFVDSMVLGTKALNFSSEYYLEEEEPRKPGFLGRIFGDKLDKVVTGLTVVFSIIMALAIFIVLPYFLSAYFERYIMSKSLLALVEGIVRILIFVIYILLISIMKDIRRVYMYHGAEHKCINCIEKGYDLNVKNVKKCSTKHKRCGTSFLLFVMVVSIIFFIFIRIENPVWRVAVRLLLIPAIAGVSYELIRLAGRSDNILVRIISAPGMWLQKLTTKEPEDDMIEVAIKAVEAVFDWKAYYKEKYNYDADGEEE